MSEYYHTKESVDEYIQLAQGIDGGAIIEKLKDILPSGSTVLELGSGPGKDWKILSEEYDVIGSDLSSEFLDRLKESNPEGRFIQLDAVTIETDTKFECVYSNKVMHHLRDEEFINSLARQFQLLHAGGIICHSFWRGKGSEVFKGMFVNYQTEESLADHVKDKFEILLLEPYQEVENDDSILLIASKTP